MFSELVTQLENGLNEIIELWTQYPRGSVDSLILSISRKDTNTVFMQLISALNNMVELPEAPLPSPRLPDSLIDFFTDIAVNEQVDNSSNLSAIYCIKTMRVALEQYMEKCIVPDDIKLQALISLHRISDEIETRIIDLKSEELHKSQQQEAEKSSFKSAKEKSTYKSIFETTSNLVLITDEDGVIVEVNPTVKIFFTGEQIIDRFCGDLLQIGNDFDQILERYPPDTNNEVPIHQNGITKTFNLQIRLLSKSYPLVKGLFFILSDITCAVDHRQVLEQRVVERTRALAKSEKLLDSIFQSIGQGILLVDFELEIIQANHMASEMYGIPLEVLIGSSYHTLTNAQGVQIMMETCEHLEEGEIKNIESIGMYVDGRTFPSLITVTSMHLDGQLFMPLIVKDITRQKEMGARIVEQKLQAEEMNVTLRNVLKSIEEEKKKFEENLSSRISSTLLPTISRIRQERDKDCRDGYLSVLHEQMISLTTDFTASLDGDLLKLSKTELRICRFIKAGLTGKEICDTMNLSFETIQTHRKNIRKKLGLRGRDVNMHTFLADRVL